MSLLDQIRAKARQNKKIIVLPEGTEERTVKAAEIMVKEQIAVPILLGVRDEVLGVAKNLGVDLSSVKIVDPVTADDAAGFAASVRPLLSAWPSSRLPIISSNCSMSRSSFSDERPKRARRSNASCIFSFSMCRVLA